MPKKLLTFLGTTPYKPCVYELNGQHSKVVSFVQEALATTLCQDWTKEDQICVFLTKEAKASNWDNGLNLILEKLSLSCKVEGIDNFKEGFGESQIQENFDLIFQTLQPNDEVWLDITNAFRSIPVFALVLLNYARFLKDIHIKAIYYGAFESLGVPAHQIDLSIPNPADRVVPIIDLKKLVDLQQWTNAANDFLKHGNALELAKLSKEQNQDEFAACLDAITGAFSVVCGKEIVEGDIFLNFSNALQGLQARSPELEAILNKVDKAFKDFGSNDLLNGFRAAQWCLQHQLYQQGITILRETILSFICTEAGLPTDEYYGRRYVETAFNCFGRDQADWRVESSEINTIERIIHSTRLAEYAGVYQDLSHKYRNDINHGGFLKKAKPAADFEQALSKHIQQLKQLHNF
jgi:CRISPR-associated Csx2 family protein